MKHTRISLVCAGLASLTLGLLNQSSAAPATAPNPLTLTVRVDQPGAKINPAMWGLFFEDINLGADGGLYAELVKNRGFEFDPRGIAFVLLSHAHIDHSGLLPLLVARGFAGAVYATAPSCDLLAVMLPDSGHLQEKEAE